MGTNNEKLNLFEWYEEAKTRVLNAEEYELYKNIKELLSIVEEEPIDDQTNADTRQYSNSPVLILQGRKPAPLPERPELEALVREVLEGLFSESTSADQATREEQRRKLSSALKGIQSKLASTENWKVHNERKCQSLKVKLLFAMMGVYSASNIAHRINLSADGKAKKPWTTPQAMANMLNKERNLLSDPIRIQMVIVSNHWNNRYLDLKDKLFEELRKAGVMGFLKENVVLDDTYLLPNCDLETFLKYFNPAAIEYRKSTNLEFSSILNEYKTYMNSPDCAKYFKYLEEEKNKAPSHTEQKD